MVILRTERLTVRGVDSGLIKRLRILSVVTEEPVAELLNQMLKEYLMKKESEVDNRYARSA